MNKLAHMVYQAALTKVASRWREAIRSGEIGAESAAKLMKRMGYTEAREIAGLNRGSVRMAKNMGIPVRYSDEYAQIPKPIFDIKNDAIRNRLVGPSFSPGHGILIDPKYRTMNAYSRRFLKKGPLVHAKNREAVNAITLRHEVDEARAMKRFGLDLNDATGGERRIALSSPKSAYGYSGVNPAYMDKLRGARDATDLLKIKTPSLQFMHAHPSVITNEVRNISMLPSAHESMGAIHANEYADVKKALQGKQLRVQGKQKLDDQLQKVTKDKNREATRMYYKILGLPVDF